MPRPSPYGVRGLYKDESDRYCIDLRFRDPKSGKRDRYTETFPDGTTLGTARHRTLEILNAGLAGTLLKRGAETAPETLGAAFDRYLEVCATNGGKSDPEYKRRHRKHWVKTLGEGFRLDAFSELAIEKHKRRRVGEGKAPGTVNRELVTIKHFLNRCVDWGWLPKRPKIVLLAEPPPRVRWLTEEERASLASELARPQRAHFLRLCSAALLSGQRLGKVIGLLKTDVDLAAGTLTVSDSAKGGKRRTHHVPISDALADVLRMAMADAGDDCPHVFATGRRTKGRKRPYSRNGASSFFAKVAEGAQISDLHFHDLRHDFATRVRRAGAGLDVLQALLGHATMAMTQRYAHLGRAELAAAAQAAEGVARALPPAAPLASRKAGKKPRKATAQRAS
jgi:integrase